MIKWSILCMLLASGMAGAMMPPPHTPEDVFEQPPAHSLLPSGATLGSTHIQFETTTLAQFMKTADGIGNISHQGDAGDSKYWVCYTLPIPPVTARLWLIADGEMGGPEHAITELIAQNAPGSLPVADCPAMPANLRQITLDGQSVLLNMSKSDFDKKIKASGSNGQWLFYSTETSVPPGLCEEAWQENWLSVQMVHGNVNTIATGQITSC